MTLKKTFWLLLMLCVLTVIPFLGIYDYNTKGEPRESIVSYSMIESGNWVLPRNSVGEMAYKPPFFHWCVAAVSVVGGKVTEFTSRVPSAVAYIMLTLATFVFYFRRKGSTVALLAALVAFTSWELHRQGANCRVDMLLTAFTVMAMLFFYRWWEKGMRGIPWWAILMLSLGTFTKGPVGTLIPCLVVGVFLLCRGVNFFRAFFSLLAFGLMSLVLPAIWYYAAWQQGGQEFLDLVLEENVGRMTQTMSYESCVEPWYYNFITLIVGYLPWVIFALMTLFVVDWKALRRNTDAQSADGGVGAARKKAWWQTKPSKADPVDLFSLLAIVVIFVFYCIPQSKRSVYIMPIYPFLGYFIARLLLWVEKRHKQVLNVYGGFLAVVGLILAVAFVVLKFIPVSPDWFHGRHGFENYSMVLGLQQTGAWWQWVIWVVGVAILALWWKSLRNVWYVVALILAVYLHLDAIYKPPVLNAKSVKAVAAAVDEKVPAGEGRLYEFIEAAVEAAGDPVHFFELNFYLGDRVGDFYHEKPQKGYLLIGADDLQEWQPKFEAEGYRFEPVYNSGDKRVIKQQLQLLKFEK